MLANQPITPGSSLRGSLLPVPDRPFGGAETSPVPRGLVAVMWPNHVHLSCGLSGSPGCSPPGRTADAVTLELHPLSGPECLRPRTSEGCAAARRTRADTPVRLPMGGIMAPPLAENFVPEIKGRCMSLALTWGTGVAPPWVLRPPPSTPRKPGAMGGGIFADRPVTPGAAVPSRLVPSRQGCRGSLGRARHTFPPQPRASVKEQRHPCRSANEEPMESP